MRFILNFIFFGVLFYAIYLAFPDAFFTMVDWAHSVYAFLKDIFLQLSDKIESWRSQRGGSHSSPQRALLLLPFWIIASVKMKKIGA